MLDYTKADDFIKKNRLNLKKSPFYLSKKYIQFFSKKKLISG